MHVLDVEQGTHEWRQSRMGVPSASSFNKIVTSKGNRSDQRDGYMEKLAQERLTGTYADSYQSKDMDMGIALEPEAIELFTMIKGIPITKVGFCMEDNGRYGCSPDGLIEIQPLSGLEVKAPQKKTHLKYLKDGKLPSNYFLQVHGSMLVTGRNSWFFMSYHRNHAPFILLVKRDEKLMSLLKYELNCFANELDQLVKQKMF